jgi:dihydroflavonol-4-reductase
MVCALITGGTGFIGSHIARQLVAGGHTARILRREKSSLKALDGLTVEHAIGDVTDLDALEKAMQGCEWVFHVAAVADYWRADKRNMYVVNVDGTRNVFNAAQKAGVQRVVFTSSGAAVGMRADGTPADESTWFNLNPARFPYGHTKFLAEAEAARAVKHGLDVVTVNPSIVMGPGDINQISGSTLIELRRGSIPAIPAGGATLIDVRDVAAAHLAAAERGRTGERYLLGAYDLSWRELMPIAAQVVGVQPPPFVLPGMFAEPLGWLIDLLRALRVPIPLDGNQMRLSAKNIFFDCHKAWHELGKPQISLHQMLTDTYVWYREHGYVY